MHPTLLSVVHAAAFLGISERTFHNLRRRPGFPAPVSLGKRALRWRRSDLDEYVRTLESVPPSPPPAHLVARKRPMTNQRVA